MIYRTASLSGDEGSRCATIVLDRLVRGGIQTHHPVRDKRQDAGAADAADHAVGHDLPVAARVATMTGPESVRPRKRLGFKTAFRATLKKLGKDLRIRFL